MQPPQGKARMQPRAAFLGQEPTCGLRRLTLGISCIAAEEGQVFGARAAFLSQGVNSVSASSELEIAA